MEPFVGSEALAGGMLTRGVLRARYTAILPNIYVAKGTELTLEVRARAAWLWSGRTGIIAGRTAAVMFSTPWAVTTDPIELIARRTEHPDGLIIRNERIAIDEIGIWNGLPRTNPARTALDISRHHPRDAAVMLLDRFCAAAGTTREDISQLADRYPGARGIRTALLTAAEIDPGALTPEETRVRLMLSDVGLRPPHSRIHVTDGFDEAVLDMGWRTLRIGIDCERADARDRSDFLQSLGWIYLTIAPGENHTSVSSRVRRAMRARRRHLPVLR